MANIVPLSLLQMPGYFTDLDGNPLASGSLQFYSAGTTTPATVYADVDGSATLTNPVTLSAEGFAAIFLGPTLYDVVVSDSLGTQLYTREGVGNAGQIVFAGLGNIQAQGSKAVSGGYAVLSTDNLITTATGVATATIQLPAASTRTTANNGNGLPIKVINFLSGTCTIVPAGADTINNDNTSIVLPASANPAYPWVELVSTGTEWFATGASGAL